MLLRGQPDLWTEVHRRFSGCVKAKIICCRGPHTSFVRATFRGETPHHMLISAVSQQVAIAYRCREDLEILITFADEGLVVRQV
jgi:hypothetical protein